MLPEDLEVEILSWLPPESLLRFISVCKSWYSTISSSNFIAKHKSHFGNPNNNENSLMVMIVKQELRGFRVNLIPDQNPRKTHKDILLREAISKSACFQIEGICGGLCCFSAKGYHLGEVMLCNPSIRYTVDVPPCRFPKFASCDVFNITYGVGFDRLANDYKVVKFMNSIDNEHPVHTKAAVYSMRSGAWKMIKAPITNCVAFRLSFFLRGFIHWQACKEDKDFILSFDVCNEAFVEICLPEIGKLYRLDSISILKDSLCLLAEDTRANSTSYQLWIMKEYGIVESWTKHLTVVRHRIMRTYNLTARGKFLGYIETPNELVLFDPETDEWRSFGQYLPSQGDAFSLVEGLELLDVKNSKLTKSRKRKNIGS